MANIQPLIDYLKINRREREARASDIYTEVVVIDEEYEINDFFGNRKLEILKSEIGGNAAYRSLDNWITFAATDTAIYIDVIDNLNQPESLQYYQRREYTNNSGTVIEYKALPFGSWSVVNSTGFLEIPLANHKSYYYYNTDTNRIIESNELSSVFIFTDEFSYDPADIPEIENDTYELDYKDHEGYDTGFVDQSLKLLLDSFYKNYVDGQNRKVSVNISQAKGSVNLFPIIQQRENRFVLKYIYPDKTVSILGLRFLNTAIKLKFRYIGSMLEFLNQTIFDEGDFDTITGENGIRQIFFDQYITTINDELNAVRQNISAVLEILYYTPKVFLKHIDTYTLWDIVGDALEESLTNIGLNKEDIVLLLLQALYEKSKTPYIFLTELLVRKTSDQQSYFYKLFNKMNTDNFIKYNDFIKNVWLQSEYVNPAHPTFVGDATNPVTVFDGPLALPYESDKTLGFYHSNVDIDWTDNNTKFKLALETGQYEEVQKPNYRTGGSYTSYSEIIVDYLYHPFQPIFIKQADKQKTALKFDSIIPAFYLKAVEEKKTVANIYTGIEYAVDIVTTLSGVGNLAKFRHLAKLASVASRFNKFQKAARYATVVSKIKLAAGVIEITSGTVNALIKLTGIKDTELGATISELLFWLEMASLSGEALGAIKNGLRNSAKKALQNEDKLLKELDNAVNKGEIDETLKTKILDDLYEIAEKTRNTGKLTIKNEGAITLAKFNKIAKRIKKEYGVDMFLIDRNNQQWSELYKKWQNKPLEGMWTDQPLKSKNYGIDLDGPAIYLFRGTTNKGVYEVTSYTVQHELFHMKMWLAIKERFPNDFIRKFHEIPDDIHEAYVLSEFVKTKKFTKWDEIDILDDLDAFNKNFGENKTLRDFESFELEDYLKNL